MSRQRAHRPFAEVGGFDAEGMVKPGAVVLPGDSGRQLNQLRGIETRFELIEQSIWDFDRSARHGVGVGERELFGFRECRATGIVGKGLDLFLRDAVFSADRRGDVNSKRTSDKRGSAQACQLFQILVD